ncbi:hypothetical protein [Blautia massiliensis (ex Durand et al. 2017)]|uniref:hypothetical protein n=1 Tax=Blautia massiliensis (ex Durand et al. 2017) TaxID=1737424 RepID=UPI00189D74B2|nr:hypothetical protein [Blautia massiliensis (ex Durand et al. 2017)]
MLENLDVNMLTGLLTGLFCPVLLNKLNSIGNIKTYIKLVHTKSKVLKYNYGFYTDGKEEDAYMYIPMWADLLNNTRTSKVVRNISLHAYMNNEEIAEFNQVQNLEDKNADEDGKTKIILLGNNETYSFVIPEKSLVRANLEFVLYKNEIESEQKNFNKIVLTYSDEKDRLHAFEFLNIRDCWKIGDIEKNKEEKTWMKVKKKFKVHKK